MLIIFIPIFALIIYFCQLESTDVTIANPIPINFFQRNYFQEPLSFSSELPLSIGESLSVNVTQIDKSISTSKRDINLLERNIQEAPISYETEDSSILIAGNGGYEQIDICEGDNQMILNYSDIYYHHSNIKQLGIIDFISRIEYYKVLLPLIILWSLFSLIYVIDIGKLILLVVFILIASTYHFVEENKRKVNNVDEEDIIEYEYSNIEEKLDDDSVAEPNDSIEIINGDFIDISNVGEAIDEDGYTHTESDIDVDFETEFKCIAQFCNMDSTNAISLCETEPQDITSTLIGDLHESKTTIEADVDNEEVCDAFRKEKDANERKVEKPISHIGFDSNHVRNEKMKTFWKKFGTKFKGELEKISQNKRRII